MSQRKDRSPLFSSPFSQPLQVFVSLALGIPPPLPFPQLTHRLFPRRQKQGDCPAPPLSFSCWPLAKPPYVRPDALHPGALAYPPNQDVWEDLVIFKYIYTFGSFSPEAPASYQFCTHTPFAFVLSRGWGRMHLMEGALGKLLTLSSPQTLLVSTLYNCSVYSQCL